MGSNAGVGSSRASASEITIITWSEEGSYLRLIDVCITQL